MIKRDPRSDPCVGDVLARGFLRVEVCCVHAALVWYVGEHLLTRARIVTHADAVERFAANMRDAVVLAMGVPGVEPL